MKSNTNHSRLKKFKILSDIAPGFLVFFENPGIKTCGVIFRGPFETCPLFVCRKLKLGRIFTSGNGRVKEKTIESKLTIERLLLSLYDDPQLVKDIMIFLADFWIELWDQALTEVEVDCAHFWEDMAYRTGPLISPSMFREFMTPCYQKVTSFLNGKGVRIILVDSVGNLDELIPLFLEAGLTGVWPIEVQAGNDLLEIRRRYPQLQIQGGINKLQIAKGREAIDQELETKVPFMLQQGGYIPHLDHLAHPGISWPDFRYYRQRLRVMIEEHAGKSR